MASKLLILFGETGVGKNYVGRCLMRHASYYFWDADEALTPEQKACIAKQQPFTQPMRNAFIGNLLGQISHLLTQHPCLAIAQGLYKEINRLTLQQHFPYTTWVYVKACEQRIHERLLHRKDLIDVEYAKLLKKGFEVPTLPHVTIYNDEVGEACLLSQLSRLGFIGTNST